MSKKRHHFCDSVANVLPLHRGFLEHLLLFMDIKELDVEEGVDMPADDQVGDFFVNYGPKATEPFMPDDEAGAEAQEGDLIDTGKSSDERAAADGSMAITRALSRIRWPMRRPPTFPAPITPTVTPERSAVPRAASAPARMPR